MGYDHDDSFPFDFELNGIPFASKSKGKLSPQSYPIEYERKRKCSFLSVAIGKQQYQMPRNSLFTYKTEKFELTHIV